jgi:hypothetical protein
LTKVYDAGREVLNAACPLSAPLNGG